MFLPRVAYDSDMSTLHISKVGFDGRLAGERPVNRPGKRGRRCLATEEAR